MFAVVAVTAAGWLLVFAGLLAAPPSARWRDRGPGYGDAQESPAVVSLLAGRLDRDGFAATLLDLSARGWFRLAPPQGSKGPVMCVVPAEAPVEALPPHEQRVVTHVAARAGAGGVVPAPALSDGFAGGSGHRAPACGARGTAGSTRPRWCVSRRAPDPPGPGVRWPARRGPRPVPGVPWAARRSIRGAVARPGRLPSGRSRVARGKHQGRSGIIDFNQY